MLKIKRALISVSDKKGLAEFAKGLRAFGVEIISTGGTAEMIAGLGIPVRQVSDYTGLPEMLDGRVKTLHPKIHAGLLALRDNKRHMETVKKHGIGLIDMVVVNLYPFEQTAARPGAKLQEVVENIDIGGPSMLRSGAKNYRSVAVICNPGRYADILDEMKKNKGCLSDDALRTLAKEVFRHTSRYDAAIAEYLNQRFMGPADDGQRSTAKFPELLNLSLKKLQDLRYGENPHQKAAFYKDESSRGPGMSDARQLHGKELSFNNILDLAAALALVREFKEPAAAIIKHANPCGAAVSATPKKAFLDALDCDRISAFGGIVGFNRELDAETAKAILKEADFIECIIAPSYAGKALAALKAKKNLRIMEVPGFALGPAGGGIDVKKVSGAFLLQEEDSRDGFEARVVTKRRPTKPQLDSLVFAWKIAKHVRSNAIVLARGTRTVGVGAGQMSRVDSVIIAARKAGQLAKGSCLASDAFFPKGDAIAIARKAGVAAIIEPGGSIRDPEVIKAADKAGIAMVFTGIRHFRH